MSVAGWAPAGDPLAGLPVPPWRPEPLRVAAATQRAAAGALTGVAARADVAVAGVVGSAWIGAAASSCDQLVARLVAAHEAAARHADAAAAVLEACAATWERADGTYQQARRLADEALREEQALRDAARAAAPDVLNGLAAGPAAASPLRERAAVLAKQAVDDFQQAARDAAAALDAHARALGPAPPAPHHHGQPWYQHALGWLSDRGQDLADAGHSLLDFGGYAASHPRQTAGLAADAAGMAIGLLGIAAGTGGEVGGTVLATTGIGLPIAVPVDIASLGLIATGVAITSASAAKANQDLGAMWAEAQSESSGGGGSGASSGGAPAGSTGGANELLRGARQVRGRFPRSAGPNEILVRRGADGAPTHYEVYGDDGLPLKRVDLTGHSHGGLETPHVVEFERHVNPDTGEVFLKPGRVRPARPDEVPTP